MAEEKFKVLIVDDEEDNLALLYRSLKDEFEIIKTTSANEALELLKLHNFTMILSDYRMPEMNGVELLKKCYEYDPNSIRILITAYSDSDVLINAINYAKIHNYIKKPWCPSELNIVINSALECYETKKENDELIYDLKELFSGTINAIIEALDAKDSFTLGKSRRVTYLSLKMSEYFKLPMQEQGKLELAGLLHDIGMIGIPEEILNKTESLEENEYEIIKKHVEHGVKILEDIKQLKEVVSIIKHHHERYDGSGYPQGLRGEEIPLNAMIIAIADSYDSMISNRSYRGRLGHEEALKRIKEQSGKQFSPVVVEAFLAIIPDALLELERFEKEMAESNL